jgi:hypothetical protein
MGQNGNKQLIRFCRFFPRTSKLQEKPLALKREDPALQKSKFINFFLFLWAFLPSWIRIANPDQDPGTILNPDPDTDQDWIHNITGRNHVRFLYIQRIMVLLVLRQEIAEFYEIVTFSPYLI